MTRNGLGRLIALLALVGAVATGCTTYRYTRAFYLPDQLPEKLPEGMFEKYSLLPEMFEDWQVWVGFSGLYDNNNAEWIERNMFKVKVRFILPGDTVTDTIFFRQRQDTSTSILLVDSVHLTLEPLGYDTVLHAMGTNRPRHRQRFDMFEPLSLPVEVEAIQVRFTARLTTAEGVEISRKEYSPHLVLWEEKRLDRTTPEIHHPQPRPKRPWLYQ